MAYYRRTTADRQAEAAVYRARSEAAAAKAIPTVKLSACEYVKERKLLKLASEYIGMPREFYVHSERTGKYVKFVAIGPEDKLFDQDGWDGEQCIYRSTDALNTIDYMVIYNQY